MFTGIITHLGTFFKQTQKGFMFVVPPDLAKRITLGSSIAIDGVCLTVTKKEATTIYVDIMPETLKKTTLSLLKANALVNLELPATTNTLFAGHIILGHIDGVSQLKTVTKRGNSRILKFSLPQNLSRYLVTKGSIAISGISLTVIEVGKDSFTVGIVPYTWNNTILSHLKIGDFVNIEVDILAKYLEKLLKDKQA